MGRKTVKLADVLWTAANKWLLPTPTPDGLRETYSCPAVGRACCGGRHPFQPLDVRDFLTSLGCDTYSASLLHREWRPTEESQGVRYMWLLLAMHAAEDEGIEIEVEA